MSSDEAAVYLPATERILMSLGRMEGKLDAALRRIDGHDADIDELRHSVTETQQALTKIKAYLVAAWAAIGLLVTVIGVIAGVVGLFK